MYLHDDRPICKVLAIDLCSRGFDTWHSYTDVMELLRSLFALATHTKKDGITTLNVGAAARIAVLQIASNSTPLVMTTLSMDILHVTDVERRKSLMQMLAFLIRKVLNRLENVVVLLTRGHLSVRWRSNRTFRV